MKLTISVAIFGVLLIFVNGKEDKDSVGTVIGIDLGTTYSW